MMSSLSTVSFCLGLLACVMVSSVHGQFGGLCPLGAASQLDKCLTALENLASMSTLLPTRCFEVQEALKCTRTLVMACFHSDSEVLKVLGLHQTVPELIMSSSIGLCLQK